MEPKAFMVRVKLPDDWENVKIERALREVYAAIKLFESVFVLLISPPEQQADGNWGFRVSGKEGSVTAIERILKEEYNLEVVSRIECD